jgi:hypothetical protein
MGDKHPTVLQMLFRPRELLQLLRDYVGIGRKRQAPIVDPDGLAQFLQTRASFIAQTSLYGYLRTRAGTRYPELFDNDPFVAGINIAKWQVWLACLSDLAVYSGGMLAREPGASVQRVDALIRSLVDRILKDTGIPADAGPDFVAYRQVVCERLAACDWATVPDGEDAFTESPDAVVRWAPVVDTFKQLDEAIVKNSVRFRWQEVRRDLRQYLVPEALLRSPG